MKVESIKYKVERGKYKVERGKYKVESWKLKVKRGKYKVESWKCNVLKALTNYSLLTIHYSLHKAWPQRLKNAVKCWMEFWWAAGGSPKKCKCSNSLSEIHNNSSCDFYGSSEKWQIAERLSGSLHHQKKLKLWKLKFTLRVYLL